MNVETVIGLYRAGMLTRKRATQVLRQHGLSEARARTLIFKSDAGEAAVVGERLNQLHTKAKVIRRSGLRLKGPEQY